MIDNASVCPWGVCCSKQVLAGAAQLQWLFCPSLSFSRVHDLLVVMCKQASENSWVFFRPWFGIGAPGIQLLSYTTVLSESWEKPHVQGYAHGEALTRPQMQGRVKIRVEIITNHTYTQITTMEQTIFTLLLWFSFV